MSYNQPKQGVIAVKITIDLTREDVESMCSCICKNFYGEQANRFVVLKGTPFKTGFMFSFERELEAIFAYSYFKKQGKKVALLFDDSYECAPYALIITGIKVKGW